MRLSVLILAASVLGGGIRPAPGVILLDAGDPARNTTTPGDNSGWQYEGQFGGFLGTPIAPFYFVTAKHIGGQVGMAFTFHGETFTTTAVTGDPDTDLQIWQVDHAFACYAPLYQESGTESGRELHVFGRGTRRGDEMSLDGTLRGWAWGTGDGVQRWGRNRVAAVVPYGTWSFLQATFDAEGLPGEAQLSEGDSGGGVFILEDGLWRLAGVNYGVDDLWTAPDGVHFAAAIFDARGYYTQNEDGSFTRISGKENVPTSFYSTQISGRLAWIQSVVGGDPATLPAEDFDAWRHAYFLPTEMADATVSGRNADPDGDGISNLLEYTFNLDPTHPETATLTADTGIRGLPLVRLEGRAAEQRLTVEFVRRTSGSGADAVCTAQFTSRLEPTASDWQGGGTETVTPINPRWERVKVSDASAMGAATTARYARVLVMESASADRASRPQGLAATPHHAGDVRLGK